MKPIFLSRVGISNFRTYGEDFSIDLPAEPSLTVICGMNGLGKTAFFDAIEWALLGEIQRLSGERLRKPKGDPLTRDGATAGSHRVELAWGSDQKIIRGERKAPSPAQLTDLLKDPDWRPQIHDLAVYLRLTHFLPQATRERFLERDGKAQWGLLQGPAGVERLERLRKLLDDGKARNAFDRHIVSLEKLQVEATQRIEDWKKLLAEQERWTNVASAAAAISPEELQGVLRELEPVVPANQAKASPEEPVKRLAAIRTALESSTTSLRNRQRDLSRLETSIRRYAELTQRIRTLQETHKNAQKDLDEIRRIQEDAKVKATNFRTTIANLEAKKGAANQLSVSALTVLDAESQRLAASKLRPTLEEKIAEKTKQLAELEQRRAAYRKQVEDYKAAGKGMEIVHQNLRALAEMEQSFAILAQRVRDYDAQGKEAIVLNERKKSLLAKRTALEKSIAGLNARIKGLVERLGIEQRSVDETTRALGQVIQHLGAEDTVCPVCSQVHPPGELLRKAQGSIERYSSRTAAVIGELRELQKKADEVNQRLTQCTRESAEVEALLGARASQGTEIEKQKCELLRQTEFTGTSLESLPTMLKERGVALRQQEQDFGIKVKTLRVSDELAVAAQQYDSAEKKLTTELQTAKAELSRADAVLQECQAKLTTSAEIIRSGGGLANLQEYRNERLREVAKFESDIRDLRGQLEVHENWLQTVTTTVAERIAKREAEEKTLAELRAESNRLVSNWRELNLEGEPNESAIQQARLRVEKKASENEKILERIDKTVVGVEAWARRTQLAALESAVTDSIRSTGANSKEHCTSILQQQLNNHVAALSRARAAKRRAENVAEKLMSLTGRFSTTALEPLSERISAFNRLISPFPYEFKLSPHVTATRTSTQARVTIPSVRSNRAIERDPEWWLSEGQMSAMGLSVLLGASTVYRWSRWRALLLDDPLQNTDLIHAAAFGDVIRSLMRDEGFQVIVSTHDHDEADFLIRKCRRANLPVQKLELLSLGPSGLKYSYRDC